MCSLISHKIDLYRRFCCIFHVIRILIVIFRTFSIHVLYNLINFIFRLMCPIYCLLFMCNLPYDYGIFYLTSVSRQLMVLYFHCSCDIIRLSFILLLHMYCDNFSCLLNKKNKKRWVIYILAIKSNLYNTKTNATEIQRKDNSFYLVFNFYFLSSSVLLKYIFNSLLMIRFIFVFIDVHF